MQCMNCINITILYVLNLTLFLFGAGVVCVSTLLIHFGTLFAILLDDEYLNLPIIVLVLGIAILVLLLAFLGFDHRLDRKMKNKSRMLNTYSLTALVLAIAQIILGTVIFSREYYARKVLTETMNDVMGSYGLPGNIDNDKSLDVATHKLQCCGVESYLDWKNFNYSGVNDGCCKKLIKGCGLDYFNNSNPPEIWDDEGCYHDIYENLEVYNIILGALAIILAVNQLLCIICACGITNMSTEYVLGIN